MLTGRWVWYKREEEERREKKRKREERGERKVERGERRERSRERREREREKGKQRQERSDSRRWRGYLGFSLISGEILVRCLRYQMISGRRLANDLWQTFGRPLADLCQANGLAGDL